MHAPLESVLEGSLAATAGMDLGLHNQPPSAQAGGHGLGLRRGVGDSSGLGGNAEFGKEFSGLKFVDIHGKKWISPTNTLPPLKGKELP
jgi:hypothetical protein